MKKSNDHINGPQSPSDRIGGSRPNPDVAATGGGGAMTAKQNVPDNRKNEDSSMQGLSARDTPSFSDIEDDLKNNP